MNTTIVDEATNTVMTENGPINLDDIHPRPKPKKVKTAKKPSKVSQILKLSDKGLTPLEISQTLGVELHYVYTARSQMKSKGVGRWHQTEQPANKKATPEVVEATFISPSTPATPTFNAYAATITAAPYTSKITFLQPARAPFFSRLKAAYAVLKGDAK